MRVPLPALPTRKESRTVAEPAQTSYDEMPYINKAFPQTHPDRLATLARLFGLQPPDVDACRVLELGCASGDNLVPMALELPNSRFVGIDLSARQIEQGQQMVRALGLANIELRQYNIADVDASWGKFDYIVSHGIYSWVPAPVRERILAICRDNLAANGVAYVSYNTLPGWHVRGMIRDMMIYHSAPFPGAVAKVQQARGLLDFLAQSTPTTSPYGMALRKELDALRNEPDAYLFHDHLEEINEPLYFHQFAETARRYGLDYLAEADFGDMLVTNLPAKVADTQQRIATDILRMEQYMDFVRNRMFRQTLLVHQGAPIRRNLDGRVVKGLLVASAAQPQSAQPVLTQGVSESFLAPSGVTHKIGDALTKAAMVQLAKQWPHCVPFEELRALCRAAVPQGAGSNTGAEMPPDDEQSFGDRLLQGYAARAVELRVAAPRLTVALSARPVASPLARLQAEHSATVTNLRHEPVLLPELPRRMLRLLDGTRDIGALVADIIKLAQEGTIGVRAQEGGPVVTDRATLEKILRQLVADDLPKLAHVALLLE
jgi:methyltransferase-like protein